MTIDDILYYLPIIVIGLGLLYLWLKWRNRERPLNIPLESLGLIVEIGIFTFIIYLVERYLFVEHSYFLLTILFFIPIWSMFVYILLKRDEIYILVSSFQGDKFHNLQDVETRVSNQTTQRLLVMNREVYEAKSHIGDLSYPFWRGSSRIHFADDYDSKKGIFYHHSDPRLKNITFWVAKPFWLKLRDELPNVIRDNIILTWLSNYSLAHKQRVMADRFKLHLKALERQHDYEPFKLPDDIDELMQFLKDEKSRGLSVLEEQIEKETKPEEAKND